MLSAAQVDRLAACARVLEPPARILLTGAVDPAALAAVRSAARPGVDVAAVAAGRPATVEGPVDLLFVGPVAPYSAAVELLARWAGRVAPGGVLFAHGAFAAPALTAALLRTVGTSRAWRYYGREATLAEYVRADLSHGERVLDAIAQLAQLPRLARRRA